MRRLDLPPDVRSRLDADALDRYPSEACGILLGEPGDDAVATSVRALRPTENAATDPQRRFSIPPEALLAAQKEARAEGLEVVGYYHSHPDHAAVPSPIDLETAWPDTSYLIVAVSAGAVREVRSWRLDADSRSFVEERIEYEAG